MKGRRIHGESNVRSTAQRQNLIRSAGHEQNRRSDGYGKQCSLAW